MPKARTIYGCWTCRIRKKKCDERQPSCVTCDTLQIRCLYGQKPVWMDGGRKERDKADSIKRSVKEGSKARRKIQSRQDVDEKPSAFSIPTASSTVTTSVAGYSSVGAHDSTSETTPYDPSPPCAGRDNVLHDTPIEFRWQHTEPSKGLDPYNQHELNLLMHYLDNVFPLQFRFYSPLVSEGGRGWLLTILLRTKPLFHAALSLSAYHQRTILPRDESALHVLEDLDKHHAMTLTELRCHIDSLSVNFGPGCIKMRLEILACLIQLISFEVFRGGNENWQMHLQAARTLFYESRDMFVAQGPIQGDGIPVQDFVKRCAGKQSLSSTPLSESETFALDFFASTLVWFDILSCVTTGLAPAYPEVFSSLLRIEDGRIQLCKLMGCKNWAMTVIMDIAGLDEWKRARDNHAELSSRELARRAGVIELRLTEGITLNLKRSLSPQIDPCGIRSAESQAVTHVFACAALIYLHVVWSGAHPELPEIKEGVLETIKGFRTLPNPCWVQSLVWPFCIAGCMATAEHEEEFEDIAAAANTGERVFGNFEQALLIMKECWKGRKLDSSGRWSWTTGMASLGLKVLLL